LARTITYKYVDVNQKNEVGESPVSGGFTARAALLFPAGGNNFCAGMTNTKKFVSKSMR
jgi:hypothetical protein